MNIISKVIVVLLAALAIQPRLHAALPTGVTLEAFYDVTKPGLSFAKEKLSMLGMEEIPGLPQHFLVLGQFGFVWGLYPDTTKNYDPHGQNEYTRIELADFNERIMKGWEQGAISGGFDPNFRENRYFYMCFQQYVSPDKYHRGTMPNGNDNRKNPGTVVIERWILADDNKKLTKDATILEVDHGKGWGTHYMTFGKDNMLWASLDSYSHNSWDMKDLERKVIRIDVSKKENGKLYAIPPDNPFVNDPDALDEIYSYGHRNLWCLFADYLTGSMWGGEIGQSRWEEINILKPGGNYGWANGGDGAGGGVGIEGPCTEMTANGKAYVYKSGVKDPYSFSGKQSNNKKFTCANFTNGTWNFSHSGKDVDGNKQALQGLRCNSIAVGPAFRGDPSSPFYGYHFISDIKRNYFVAAIEGKEEVQNVGGFPSSVTLADGTKQEIKFTGDTGHNGIITFSEDSYGHLYVILASSSSKGCFAWHDIYRVTHPDLKPLDKPRYSVHPMVGCMDPTADNYDKDAYVDDKESCKHSGVQRVNVPGIATISQKMVAVDAEGPHSVEIRNLSGKLVFSESHNGPYNYSLTGIFAGIYQVKVTTPGLIKTEKILLY